MILLINAKPNGDGTNDDDDDDDDDDNNDDEDEDDDDGDALTMCGWNLRLNKIRFCSYVTMISPIVNNVIMISPIVNNVIMISPLVNSLNNHKMSRLHNDKL